MNVRERILDAALDLFAEKGYATTSVAEVVAKAGVTKGAMYHYFTSKDDILLEIYGSVFTEQLKELDRIIALNKDSAWTLRAIIESIVVGTTVATKQAALITRELSRIDDQRHQALIADWRRYQDGVRQVIRQGQEEGVFNTLASPEVSSWTIFGFTNSLHTWFRPDGPKTPQQIAQELADFVLAGLGGKK